MGFRGDGARARSLLSGGLAASAGTRPSSARQAPAEDFAPSSRTASAVVEPKLATPRSSAVRSGWLETALVFTRSVATRRQRPESRTYPDTSAGNDLELLPAPAK